MRPTRARSTSVTEHNPNDRPYGSDTPTGTDPAAKYTEPGYQDKSLGQAVNQDAELVDELLAEEDDERAAEARFEQESAGAPKLAEQRHRTEDHPSNPE
jgi:hypothetical protein